MKSLKDMTRNELIAEAVKYETGQTELKTFEFVVLANELRKQYVSKEEIAAEIAKIQANETRTT
jgi:hypothetical protein